MSKRKLILLIVSAFTGFLTAYYFYSQPYEITTNNLVISAAFPSKPTVTKIAGLFSSDNSSGISTYQVSQEGISYILSITNLSIISAKPNFSQAVIFRQMFNNLVPEYEKKSGFVRAEVMGNFDGQIIKYKLAHKYIYAKYFIASNSLVAIYVKIKGAQLTTQGVAFVESLTIKERKLPF